METEKVMDKLRDEMAAKHGDTGIQIIGEAMTRMLRLSPNTAEAVGTEGKTLAGAFAAVRSWAEKHKNGNSCFVPPTQAVEIVCEYYGLPDIAEVTALMGFDFLLLDNEHGVIEQSTLADMVRASQLRGVPAVVRCTMKEYDHIQKALDFGANGVQLPLDGSGDGGIRGLGGNAGKQHTVRTKLYIGDGDPDTDEDKDNFIPWDQTVVDIQPGKGTQGVSGGAGCVVLWWEEDAT